MFDNLLMSMNSKLKKIMSGLETNEGKIDGISTSVSNTYTKANSAASNTATNNTANKTGVLSAKLAYIISLLENTTYGLSALKTATSNSGGLTSCIKSIQSGYVNYESGNKSNRYKDVTISAVTTSKSIILFSGGGCYGSYNNSSYSYSYDNSPSEVMCELTSSTNLRFLHQNSTGATGSSTSVCIRGFWQVIEFY